MDFESTNGEFGEYVNGVWIPMDPMDLLMCDSCQ